MATIRRFEDTEAWQSARELRKMIYLLTRTREFAADFALVGQIRRAAISTGSNIAEGFERGGNREFVQFLSNAKGSVGEIKDQLYCALNERYITPPQFEEAYAVAQTTSKLVGGFMIYLQHADISGTKFVRSCTTRTPNR